MAVSKVVFLMADYGHDPTGTLSVWAPSEKSSLTHSIATAETSVPFVAFKNAGFDVQFATEKAVSPRCDKVLIEGFGQKILGAAQSVLKDYATMLESTEWKNPHAWSTPGFSLDPYAFVFLPGGHDKAVRQVLDSTTVQALLASYFPKTQRKDRVKGVGAICHGVLALANAKGSDGQSILRDCTTTTLPGRFEQVAYWGTRLFLGDYYKTYGAGSEDVEDAVKKCLKDPKRQFQGSLGLSPFVVEDKQCNYISARFPADAEEMSRKMVDLIKSFS
ncbi:hypothetical protein G7046_g3054 [Stylonectria norvegica]|nr:hypothetical protein G7046_g3054 [Stylonectria norvegica]